jgi:hypothetical protein
MEGHSLSSIAVGICEKFAVDNETVTRDIGVLVDDLLAAGLLKVVQD